MSYLRVKNPGAVAILNPVTGLHEVPDPSQQYEADHPLVQAARWAFATEDEIAAERDAVASRTSVPLGEVEQATAAPGERRNVRRQPPSQGVAKRPE